jgi:predicted amidohydrolase
MTHWKIAGVQMDCRLADKSVNLAQIRGKLREAAGAGARLTVFPECALTGYSFTSKAEAWPHAEPLPGPAVERLAADCRELGVWAVVGLLERDGDRLFNACALVGPRGFAAGYRKVHLPCMGIDRFATPGDRPFAVHDLGGLRVGMNICYDGSFPEAARVLTLLGADLIVLPTNWTTEARAACHLPEARALENHVYYLAVNRAGEERGFRFAGRSRLIDYRAEVVSAAGDDETIIYGEVEPEKARAKRVVVVPGQHEVNRVGDRRPEMYSPLVLPAEKSAGLRGPASP